MTLNRRLFLRGLGGAAVAAPFLSSVTERAAKAQGAPAAGDPKRLIVMFTHYGCVTDKWFPQHSHGPLTSVDYEQTSIEALAPYADKLLMPRGIRAMNEWTETGSLGQVNGPNYQAAGSFFTCAPLTPNVPEPYLSPSRLIPQALGTSLDHVCAQQLSPNATPLFMRVGGASDSADSAISYSESETPFPGIGTVAQAFHNLTGILANNGVLQPDSYKVARGQSILDVVKDDLETLERVNMSMSDKEKLAAWKALLDDTGKALVSAQCGQEQAIGLGLTEANISDVSQGSGDRVTVRVTETLDHADLYSNVAVLTTLCDANRTIFIKYPANYIFRGLGLEMTNLSLASRVGSPFTAGACVDGVNDTLVTLDKYYAAKFAHLVGTLDSFDEGDSTVLDNCAAVWFQECSDGLAVNLNNMPIIQAGGCGGYFKTGQAINVEDGAVDLHRGNSSVPCEIAGEIIDRKAAGTPPEFGNAPINKYYCNLMNAIGVKAGPDGFPLVDGPQEVTHYGMYDDTRDFASGGELPVKINDPGEFSALRKNT